MCPAGQQYCDGSCVDMQTHPDHCGGCGNDCAAGDVCLSGVCHGGGVDNTGGSSGAAAGGTGGSSGGSETAGAAGAAGALGGAGRGGSTSTQSITGCEAADWPTGGARIVDGAGTSRAYLVSLPVDYNPSVAYPLVFVWHGPCQTAEQVAAGSEGSGFVGLGPLAGETAILIAGQGLADPYTSHLCPNATSPEQTGEFYGWANLEGGDVAFAEAMLDEVAASYCIDQDRVFATGVSSGGLMSNTVGCALGDRFRAIAPIMPSSPPALSGDDCVGQVAVWLTHGRNDDVVGFALGVASRDYWLATNSCGSVADAVGPGECVEYLQCDPDSQVVWCPTDEYHVPPAHAAEAIWQFFSSF